MEPDEVDKAISEFLKQIGAKGGRAKSERKAASSRANGAKGGRLRKPKESPGMGAEGKE